MSRLTFHSKPMIYSTHGMYFGWYPQPLTPSPFPLPSKKKKKEEATKLRENTQHKGQGFLVKGKEWGMNYFRPKAIIF